jgi:hypothetical protein
LEDSVARAPRAPSVSQPETSQAVSVQVSALQTLSVQTRPSAVKAYAEMHATELVERMPFATLSVTQPFAVAHPKLLAIHFRNAEL